jgi:hypothetical protein
MPSNVGLVVTVKDGPDILVALLARRSSGEKLLYVNTAKSNDALLHVVQCRLNEKFAHKGFLVMAHAGGIEPSIVREPNRTRNMTTPEKTVAQYLHLHTTREHWEATFGSCGRISRHKLVPARQAQVRCPKETRAIKAALKRVFDDIREKKKAAERNAAPGQKKNVAA